MLVSIKDKSLNVFLLKGFISDNHVKAQRCENCKATSEVLAINYGNPNLLLYGCRDSKCKNRLLRLNFNEPPFYSGTGETSS
jgi:hypothetical protein